MLLEYFMDAISAGYRYLDNVADGAKNVYWVCSSGLLAIGGSNP